ncbi:MAG: LytR/AlgR family response regulator transcription factor [Putridiphycobacter sp.]
MKAIIVEDEENGRVALKNLIENYCPHVTELLLAENITVAEKIIRKEKPELFFLDIELPDGTGFNLLQKIPAYNFNIIFITAYDNFAEQAFKYSAVDYILKPYDPIDVLKAVEKAKEEQNKNDLYKKVEALLQNQQGINKITLPTNNGYVVKKTEDIVYLESSNTYTFFYFKNQAELLVTKTLKHFEKILTAHNFVRIHQSYLINMAYVEKYIKGEGGSVILNGKELPVSRRKKTVLLDKLKSDLSH